MLCVMRTQHWLIGVTQPEVEARKDHRFLDDLAARFRAAKREMVGSIVRNVPAPASIQKLQARHGLEFVEFYYIEVGLRRAAESEGFRLTALELVFEAPKDAKVYSIVAVPPKFLR
jgi:hypothetical protein